MFFAHIFQVRVQFLGLAMICLAAILRGSLFFVYLSIYMYIYAYISQVHTDVCAFWILHHMLMSEHLHNHLLELYNYRRTFPTDSNQKYKKLHTHTNGQPPTPLHHHPPMLCFSVSCYWFNEEFEIVWRP